MRSLVLLVIALALQGSSSSSGPAPQPALLGAVARTAPVRSKDRRVEAEVVVHQQKTDDGVVAYNATVTFTNVSKRRFHVVTNVYGNHGMNGPGLFYTLTTKAGETQRLRGGLKQVVSLRYVDVAMLEPGERASTYLLLGRCQHTDLPLELHLTYDLRAALQSPGFREMNDVEHSTPRVVHRGKLPGVIQMELPSFTIPCRTLEGPGGAPRPR